MTLSRLLATATALGGSLALMAAALPAAAEVHCLDDGCKMLSLESLDGIIPANAETFLDTLPAAADNPSTETPHYGTWGIDLTGMDTKVKPGDNFYDYVNGTATKNMVIPADRTSYGAFVKLAELSEARSKAIIMDLAAKKESEGRRRQDRRRLQRHDG
jgi:putative endopeptidase